MQYLPVKLRENTLKIVEQILQNLESFASFYYNAVSSDTHVEDDEEYFVCIYFISNSISIAFNRNELYHAIEELSKTSTVENITNRIVNIILSEEGYIKFAEKFRGNEAKSIKEFFGSKGFIVRILSSSQFRQQEILTEAIKWMHTITLACDGICSLICSLMTTERLINIMNVIMPLDKLLSRNFQNLLLALMSNQSFKMTAAVAYASCYRKLCDDYQKGLFNSALNSNTSNAYNSIFNLSVQFLNREYFVYEISHHYEYLESSILSLQQMINPVGVSFKDNKCLAQRRYSPIVGDLKVSSHFFLNIRI